MDGDECETGGLVLQEPASQFYGCRLYGGRFCEKLSGVYGIERIS